MKHEYCYATDDLDVDRIVATFTPDGVLDVPIHEHIEGHDGLAAYFEWFAEREYQTRAHNVFNHVIDVDRDTATGEWYYMVLYTLPGRNAETSHGHDDVEFVRTDDGWKLSSTSARRRITREVSADAIE
ncbi:nuclear transport factor 2 family protein [Natronomonas salsuginis]|uniref:Nuclear transport factor 2 family protein n=1 Tax=Natronomonas salsuginis TaxID=2217661 RepID=A0A4U5JGY1_9EURY|nr:nuclear transport factor 2 family protein [Natronomonas salsuginis]TKR28115.1 nuclear transport factor 2 family protein [Natronomonas salsuginis]